jgi:hypothetical protein
VLEEKFTSLLKGIAFSDDTLAWVRQALRESHRDERQFHDDAIAKLQREHGRFQDRVDAMYEDKLDGRIGNDFFDAKAAEMRAAQGAIMRDMAAHQTATAAISRKASNSWSWRTMRTPCSRVSPQRRNESSWILYSRTALGKAAT